MLLAHWLGIGWNSHFAFTEVLAEGTGILVLLSAAALIYRTFREKYLFLWIVGWLFYLVYREGYLTADQALNPKWWLLGSQISFVVSISLLVAAALLYAQSQRLLLPLAVTAFAVIDLLVIRSVWFSGSLILEIAIHVLYRLIPLAGIMRLIVFNRGRNNLGPWMMATMLAFVHLDGSYGTTHIFHELDLLSELLLGLSMLIVVLDDSRARAESLGVVNTIATAIAEAGDTSFMMETALTELKKLTGASATWLRLQQGSKMVITHHVNLPSDYIRTRRELEIGTSYSDRLLVERIPAKLKTELLDPNSRSAMEKAGFDHVLLIPVAGKKAVIGVLSLGMSYERSYTNPELRFLATIANQLGLALENLGMFDQIMRSQRQWVSTFDSIEDMILVHDIDGRILRVNRALANKLHPRRIEEVIGTLCSEILPNSPHGCPYCQRPTNAVTDEPDISFGGYSLVSTSRFIENSGAKTGVVHVVRDTTALRAAEERYRQLFEAVHEGVFISTAEGRILECNDAFLKLLGYESRTELFSIDIANDLYDKPEDRERFLQQMRRQGFVRNLEVSIKRSDGSVVTLLENSFATRKADGSIDRIQGFLVDITEKKLAEEEIRRHNRELNTLNRMAAIASETFDLDEILNLTLKQCMELFEVEMGGVLLFEPESRILRRRATWGHRLDHTGLTELEIPDDFLAVITKSRAEMVRTEDLPKLPAAVKEFVKAEQIASWRWLILWTKDSPLGVLGLSSRKRKEFSSTDESLLLAIGRQLATTIEKVRLYEATSKAYEDLRRTQEQLLQSEKMSAVGQLISGVAHELNNPLTAILGYAQLLENEPIGERGLDFVQKLFKQAQRTHRVVQNLLSFARQRKVAKLPVDLPKVVDETLALRDYDLKLNNIEVQCSAEPNLPPVIADQHQLEQVFLNIVNNAVDAMLEKGRSGNLRVRVYREMDFVCAEFHDSGPGIKDPKKIFDPFYTTKKIGKGTGLGLSICYGITKEHGGEIQALNHPAGGAIFRVLLPASTGQAVVATEIRGRVRDHGVHGQILLVDDEEAILEFEREVLTGAGANVVSVTSGDAALQKLAGGKFDVVLLDGKMPGTLSGADVFKWIQENRPELAARVVFTVSHASEAETHAFVQQSNIPFLVKPFEVGELLAAVRKVSSVGRASGA